MKARKWLFMEHAPLILRPKVDAAMLSSLVKMLANLTVHPNVTHQQSRLLRLADYSHASLHF